MEGLLRAAGIDFREQDGDHLKCTPVWRRLLGGILRAAQGLRRDPVGRVCSWCQLLGRTGTVEPRVQHFGEKITADHRVLS